MLKLAAAFVAGAVAGGLFVKWYVETNAARIAGDKLGAAIFGEGTAGAKIVGGLSGIVDEVRN